MKAPVVHLADALRAIRQDGETAAARTARFPEDLDLFAPPPHLASAIEALCAALGEPPIGPSTYAFASYYSKLR